MYIRRITTRRTASDQTYHSYRLVESRREGGRARQIALLNLGRHFDLPEAVEAYAQAIAARLLARAPVAADAAEFAEVDVASLELVQPRAVGVEATGRCGLSRSMMESVKARLSRTEVTEKLA